jgi:spore coat polysaccharide biosynthesis protein SpsF
MNVVIIQARLGSSRLPGKVLKDIFGKPQLLRLCERIAGAKKVDKLVVATTDLAIDDPIDIFCRQHNIACSRGSEWDVLDRYIKAADLLQLNDRDTIIRITADCPLHSAEVIDFAIENFNDHKLDYFSNSFAPHYEDGCDTEVFGLGVLREAWGEATLLSQREHVTPFVKDSGRFLCGYKKFDERYRFKLSVDTPEDFETVEGIFRHFSPRTDFTVREIIDLLETHPEMLEANRNSVINSGYAKSLQNDKEVK